MNLVPFTAASAADAVTQIREQLGPQAVVVHVRPLVPQGLSRLWRKSRFEVLAYRPQANEPSLDLTSDAPALPGNRHLPQNGSAHSTLRADATAPREIGVGSEGGPEIDDRTWPITAVLERAGLLPVNAQRILDGIQRRHGSPEAPSLPEQLTLARHALADLWRRPPALLQDSLRPHLLVGAPGAGKTTCLCKWLTQSVLVEGKAARVWRLDGATANTAESLEVYCQALGVSVERAWRVAPEPGQALHFIDLPGIDWRNEAALQDLSHQVRSYLSPHVHLVLNAAYDTPLLLQQVRAFGLLPVEDIIVTHLDEETRWAKVWNLALGTNFPLRFLSAGQNIPGNFLHASPEHLAQWPNSR